VQVPLTLGPSGHKHLLDSKLKPLKQAVQVVPLIQEEHPLRQGRQNLPLMYYPGGQEQSYFLGSQFKRVGA
jgi:hypothetical protein